MYPFEPVVTEFISTMSGIKSLRCTFWTPLKPCFSSPAVLRGQTLGATKSAPSVGQKSDQKHPVHHLLWQTGFAHRPKQRTNSWLCNTWKFEVELLSYQLYCHLLNSLCQHVAYPATAMEDISGKILPLELPISIKLILISVHKCIFSFLINSRATFSVLFRTIESLRLEKTSEIIWSNCQHIPSMPTNHGPQCHIYTFLEHLQGWWLLTTPFEKKIFLLSNLNLPQYNLRPFPLILSLLPGSRGQPPPHHNLF